MRSLIAAVVTGVLLLAATCVSAAEYYIDSATGDDAAVGTAQGKPWKTIAKINASKFQPGDQILFKRGGVWREQLMPPSDGVKDKPIVFGAYGDGAARPRILGSIDKTGQANWTQDSANPKLWAVQGVKWEANFFKLRQGMIFHDGIGGQQRPKKDDLKSDWEWWIDQANARAYVYLGHNPGTHAIEIQQRPGKGEASVGFAGNQYITIKDLEFAYAEIAIGIWAGKYWTIENCLFHDIVVDAVHINGPADNRPHGNIIRNCEFRDWNWKGYKLMEHNWKEWGKSEPFMGYAIHVFQGDDQQVLNNRFTVVNMLSKMDCSPIAFDNGGHAALIEGNYVDGANRIGGPSGGLMLWATKGTTPMVVRNNVFKNIGGLGIIFQDCAQHKFEQPVTIENNILTNMCGDDLLDQEVIRVWSNYAQAGLVTVRNNLIYNIPQGKNTHAGIRVRQSKAVVENNTVVTADQGLRVENNSTVAATGNISTGAYQAACSVTKDSKLTESRNCWNGKADGFAPDASDKSAAPKFTDPAKSDFSQAKDSPCAGLGADVTKLPKQK